jgi:hypothetical protein
MEVVDETETFFVAMGGLQPMAHPGDERRLGSATTLYGTVALSFVIPSVAEGSAVQRTFPGNDEFLFSSKIVISTGAQRSGEICVFFHVPMGKAVDGAHPSTDQGRR